METKHPIGGKWLVAGIILLFVGTFIIPVIAHTAEKPLPASRGNRLYVGGDGPGNYTKIQDAVDNASEGDTVFVFHDSSPYYEHVMISKSITLQGEERDTTVVDGSNTGDVITISADNVCVSGFTLQKSDSGGAGVLIDVSELCVISSCVLTNNYNGVCVTSSSHNTISECSILSNYYGILLYETYTDPHERAFNQILWNTIQYNVEGIDFSHGMSGNVFNTVWGNNISYNTMGMAMITSADNDIAFNDFFSNEWTGLAAGMCEGGGDYNTIHQNNFINGGMTQAEDGGGGTNFWDYNHWSDYNGSDENGDGYGDTPYLIPGDSNGQDHSPLMSHAGWDNQPPNPAIISGSNVQEAGMMATYTFRSVDPNDDEIFYSIDWGDGTSTGLIGPFSSNYQFMRTHTWSAPGYYVLAVRATDGWGADRWSSLIVQVSTITEPVIAGPAKGNVDVSYTYNFTSNDPLSHLVFYSIDWGDGSNSSWLGPYTSGAQIQKSHTWAEKGNYVIKAKAKDVYGNEGDWGILRISMPKTVAVDFSFLRFLHWFPHAFPLLRYLIGFYI